MSGLDQSDVERFLTIYASLRDQTDDDPHRLSTLALVDDRIRTLCVEVQSYASRIIYQQQRTRRRLPALATPAFLEAWRDFEERYSRHVAEIFLTELSGSPDGKSRRPDEAYKLFDHLAGEARDDFEALNSVFAFTEGHCNTDLGQDLTDSLERGLATWRNVKDTLIDFEGVLRRAGMVGSVLIALELSGSDAKLLSLKMLLHQAQNAFIAGIPPPCLALLCALLEFILRTYYGSDGDNLKECIDSADRLPTSIEKRRLHDLTRIANAVLHPGSNENVAQARFSKPLVENWELSLIVQLDIVRKLIEDVAEYRLATIIPFSPRPR